MKEATNSIWTDPMLSGVMSSLPPSSQFFPEIDRQLHTFLAEQIDKWQPQLIIVVERKGTAIIRALIEWEESPLNWSWKDVISSESVDQMPDDFFRNKKILIFDDMMKTAGHVLQLLKDLSGRGLFTPTDSNIRIAVFAVHESCPDELELSNGHVPYAWFYRHLSPVNYRSIQIQIVEMLQRAGSLMLDTEHVEVRIRLHSGFQKLLNAARRKAKALVFHSSDQRANVTVFYEDDDAHSLSAELFPPGTGFSDIVKKCRIIDRGGDEYALIPICFPSVPQSSEDWPTDQANINLLGDGVKRSTVARFNGAGLLAALEVLKWVLKDLAVLGDNDCAILLPKSLKDESKSGYTLAHLQVVFPTLDIEDLTQRIAEIERQASSDGVRLRSKKFELTPSPSVTDEELRQDSIRLLQVIGHIYDQRVLEERMLMSEEGTCHPPGLTLGEIFNIGEKLGWEKAITSTLCDILIDQAALSTEVEEIKDENGEVYMKRTFAPAGEVISGVLRRYTTQWGLPHGF